MYLATRVPAAGSTLAEPREASSRRHRGGVSRNVYMLGFTSMFTDVSSEMVAAVLPLYFTTVLGFSPTLFGVLDGTYRGLAVLLTLGAAVTADRSKRHKRVAGSGYGLSAASRLGLLAAGGAWAPVLGWLTVDRLGKGIRTAPRDALISLSSTRARLGASYGVHRSLDTLGAVIGPLAATLVLVANPAGYNSVFLASFFIALVGLGVLSLFVVEPQALPTHSGLAERAAASRAGGPTDAGFFRSAIEHLAEPAFRRLCLAVLTLALVAPGDALLLLALERRMQLGASVFPLLFFGVSVVFVATAAPIGRLADRVGRIRVLLVGELVLAGAFVVAGSSASSLSAVVVVLALVGVYYAATDGILMALASSVVPDETRTTGLAVVLGTAAIGHLAAAAAFGVIWSRAGPQFAARVFAVGVLVAIVVAKEILRPLRAGDGGP